MATLCSISYFYLFILFLPQLTDRATHIQGEIFCLSQLIFPQTHPEVCHTNHPGELSPGRMAVKINLTTNSPLIFKNSMEDCQSLRKLSSKVMNWETLSQKKMWKMAEESLTLISSFYIHRHMHTLTHIHTCKGMHLSYWLDKLCAYLHIPQQGLEETEKWSWSASLHSFSAVWPQPSFIIAQTRIHLMFAESSHSP